MPCSLPGRELSKGRMPAYPRSPQRQLAAMAATKSSICCSMVLHEHKQRTSHFSSSQGGREAKTALAWTGCTILNQRCFDFLILLAA